MKKKITYTILLILFSSTLVYSSINIIIWHKDNNHTKQIIKELQDTVDIKQVDEEIEIIKRINFDELKDKNKDTIGWIEVNNTNINYPFVQTSNNDYYLNHSFDKKYTDAGWVFMDYRNTLNDKNIIIYGHARKDKSMFGTLKNTLKSDWINDENNHIITIYLKDENRYYQVFSTYHIKTEDYYITPNIDDEDEYMDFLNTLKDRSTHNYNVDLTKNDKILTLSSCYNNTDKIVLHAKLIKIEAIN